MRHGYSIDDAARVLIICVLYADIFDAAPVRAIAETCFNYLKAAQLSNGRFHNFRDKDGKFIDDDGGDDSFGRAIWTLGIVLTHKDHFGIGEQAREVFEKAKPALASKSSFLRSQAYASLGLSQLDPALAETLQRKIAEAYRENSAPDWRWFENKLTYANGILPYALLSSHMQDVQQVGLEALNFLNQISRVDGIPAPIGNQNWYERSGIRSVYDQQCLEAADMVLANARAYQVTRESTYLTEVEEWLAWFVANNTLHVTMVTSEGGCYDGITETGVNENQGAESVIAYLFAHLEFLRITQTLH